MGVSGVDDLRSAPPEFGLKRLFFNCLEKFRCHKSFIFVQLS